MKEWTREKKWNPFNSYKLLAHVYRWRLIQRGSAIPHPALVTVDPINHCNLECIWCNARYVLKQRHEKISRHTLLALADFLGSWQGNPELTPGVEAVCIAGGGEPLLHPDVGEFIERCVRHGIEVGVVTNGTLIDEFIEPLSLCTWVGVSVDAGSSGTFKEMKGKDLFDRLCHNTALLADFSRSHDCRLGKNRPGYGISYKYLLYNGNIKDVVPAAKRAKEIGCKNFHLRPAGIPWDNIGTGREKIFDPGVRQELADQINAARALEDDAFSVYGITHKFDPEFNRANHFQRCHALFMTAVFMPPMEPDKECLRLGMCCDRRGDTRVECRTPIADFCEINAFWGSDEHWKIFDNLDIAKCPRCTYQPHNQIFEHVIAQDCMTYKFI